MAAQRKRIAQETSAESWFYGRISIDREGMIFAISRQFGEVGPLSERLSMPITRRYEDNSISATDPTKVRPGFEQLLADLAAAPYPKPAVIVWHTDRLIRVTRDLERVIETDVNVYALMAGHIDLSTPAGRAVARTIVAWTTYEGEIRTERQLAAFFQMANAGVPHWSARPFGFELDGQHRQVEADALRGAYDAFITGKSFAAIARSLNDQGFTGSKGKPFTPETISFVLASPRNAALREYQGEIVGPAAWNAIVTEDKWRAAIRIFKDPKRRKYISTGRPQSLLSGGAVCGPCGHVVKSSKRYNMLPGGKIGPNPKRQSYAVYKCAAKGHVSHRQEFVDKYVLKVAEFLLRNSEYRSRWLGGGAGDAAGRAKLDDRLEGLRAHMEELVLDRADGTMTKTEFATAKARVLDQIADVEDQLAAIGTDESRAGLAELARISKGVANMPTDKARTMIRSLIPRIELRRQGAGLRTPDPEHIGLFVRGSDGSLVELPTVPVAALEMPATTAFWSLLESSLLQ